MAQLIKGNYNALMWLQAELQQSLSHALNALNSYIDGEAEDKTLSDCVEALYQVKGTVEMLNLNGAAMLAEEMQQTVAGLRDGKIGDRDKAQDALVHGLLLLPNYLDLLGNDLHDHPLSLLDSINELRQARQLQPYLERDLFQPLLSIPLPDSVAPNPYRQLPEIAIETTKLGHAFQVMLLSWLRQQDNESLRKMRGVVHYLRLACQQEKSTLLWWSAETLLEALEQDGLQASSQVKQLLGKLVLPIKLQCEQSEDELLVSFPTEVVNSLLLQIAHASSHGPHVTLLKTTFDLHFFDQKQKIYGMSDNALGDAHLALLEQLQDLKEQINDYDRDQDLNANIIEAIIQQLQSMTDTLALLAEYEASNLLHHQEEKLQAVINEGQRPDEETLTELADTLLQVEIFIQSSTQANVNDQLRNTVMSECLLEMANIKENLTLLSQTGQYQGGLGDTSQQLKLIAGSMTMLNYPEAAEIIEQTASKIEPHTSSLDALPPYQFNRLAEILACCDIYMEGIKQHGHAEKAYLDEASEKLISFDDPEQEQEQLQAVVTQETVAEPTETEQDPTLAELDTLLTGDDSPLVFELETDTPPATDTVDLDQPAAEQESAISAPVQPAAETLAEPENWQFAEDIDEEIAAIFIEEANEVLSELDRLVPQWQQTDDSAALMDIRRHFHTLKGSGRMAGATVLGELAWAVEQILNHVIDGTRPQSASVKQLVSRAHHQIPALLVRFTQAENAASSDVVALLALQQQILEGSADIAALTPVSDEVAAAAQSASSPSAVERHSQAPTDVDEILDISAYEEADEIAHAEVMPSDFTIETSVLTGVELYIRRQTERSTATEQSPAPAQPVSATVSSVEDYIRQHAESGTVAEQSHDLSKPASAAMTGVARYIDSRSKETGVARYLRLQTPRVLADTAPIAATMDKPATVAVNKTQLSSVDRYLINQDRQQRPATSVERYLKAKDEAIVSEVEAEQELSEQDELLQIFIAEAQQHIASLQQGMQEIGFSRQLNKNMLRSIHSLKGCANIAGIRPMALVATEMDQAFKRLHAQDVVLTPEQMSMLDDCITGLEQILNSLTEGSAEPDIRQLSDYIYQLTPSPVEQQAPVIDPEFLVVLLEETDELLNDYTQQLAQWQDTPSDQHNLAALKQTLTKLQEAATQAEQTVIADLYAGLNTLISESQPHDPELDRLLEQGYEQLNEHIESLIQNKAVATDKDFSAQVSEFLAARAEAAAIPVSTQDIDETEFALPDDLDNDLLEAFTEEAEELLHSSGQAIKGWQADTHSEQDSLQLQRDLHTLKGGARLAGISPMADLTHHMETLVLTVSDQRYPANETFFDLLQRCQDRLTEMQEQLAARHAIKTALSLIAEISQLTNGEDLDIEDRPLPEPELVAPVEKVLPDIQSVPGKIASPAPVEQVRVRADLLDYLTNFAGEVSISRDRVTQQHNALHQQLHEMEETVARLHEQLRKLEIETETQILFRYEDEKQNEDMDFDPLELDRFSMIQQLSRSLTESVIDLNDISRSMDALVKETDAILLQQSRLNTDLQQGLMNTRLLPFSGVVPRLERIVRQTTAELNKKAELTISGAELELDRTILDRLVAPVEHILRNAIAHGIEEPEQRLTSGKLEHGQLNLRVAREGSEMVLTLSDDGRGISVDKIKDKALALNLISADDIPSDDELIQLILTSGFSTADSISQLAGRGVGMDVVSNEIRALKGRLTIQSLPGEGTTFEIRLPLTLSVVQALLVRVQDEQYAVPLGSVNAGERISVRDIKLLLGTHKPRYQFNGEQYDFMPLSSLLAKPLALPDNLKQQLPLLLFRSGEIRIALLVDAIISNREIVIKSVGKQLGNITAINGATILGDGRVVFILDIPTLIETSDKPLLDHNPAVNLGAELEQRQEKTPIAMVVDDSITMRKASGNLLKRLGFNVMTARDGVDALSQLHEQKPDIILLDVEMPRMDGFEFASIVRNDQNFRHLPIIMITSRTGDKHRERAMGIGVNAYLGKPYQEEELVANMKRLLGVNIFQGQLS